MDPHPEDDLASPAGAQRARSLHGFCHVCETDVVPVELEDDNFGCPHCHEACVECPYDSFERWAGIWNLRYANGYINQLTIDEQGVATLRRNDGGGSGAAQLIWAPGDHVGYQMRLEGHLGSGVREHLHLEAGGGSLAIRHETADGGVIEGNAGRAATGELHDERTPADVAMAGFEVASARQWSDMISTMMNGAMESLNRLADGENSDSDEAMPDVPMAGGDLHHAINQGVDRLTANWPGLSDADRERMRHQLRQFTAPFAGVMTQNERLMRAYLQQLNAEATGAFSFNQLFGGPAQYREEPRERFRVPERDVAAWLNTRGIDSAESLEPDWQCSICFDSTAKELVAVCVGEKGGTSHAFHRRCVEIWLARRNECPTCRRTPIIEAVPVPAPPQASSSPETPR